MHIGELFGLFDMEARQGFFPALVDSRREGREAVTFNSIASGLLRVPSIRSILGDDAVSRLLDTFGALPLGQSGYDHLQRLVDPTMDPPQRPPHFNAEPSASFVPLEREAAPFLLAFHQQHANAAPQSVTARQVLKAMLEWSPALASLFEAHGITSAILDRT